MGDLQAAVVDDSSKANAAALQSARAAFDAGDYGAAARLSRSLLNNKEPALGDSAAQWLAALSVDPLMIGIYVLCLTVLGWAGVSYLQ